MVMALHLEGGETLLILRTQQVNPPKETIRAKMEFQESLISFD